MVDGDRERSGRRLLQAPASVGRSLRGQLDVLRGRCTDPAGEPLGRQLAPRRRRGATGWGGRRPPIPGGANCVDGDARRRPGRAAGPARSGGADGHRKRRPRAGPADRLGSGSTRPTTDSVSRIGHPAPAHDGDEPGQLIRGQHVQQRRGGDQGCAREVTRLQPGRCLSACVSTVTGGAVGGRAGRRWRRRPRAGLRSRSCRTQRCGPGSSGASQRPIEPVPQPRSWITHRPVDGGRRARCSARSRDRAAASAGSRSASQPLLTRALLGGHRDAPARTAATTDRGGRPARERLAALAGGLDAAAV